MATVVILISFVLMFALALMLVIPLIVSQFNDFAKSLPNYISQLQQLIASPEKLLPAALDGHQGAGAKKRTFQA